MRYVQEVGLVYQPHYQTNCFRVNASACANDENFIIVCDDRSSYYGVWKWYKKDVELKAWMNNKRLCYCIPIDKCEKVQDNLTNPFWIEKAQEVCKKVRKK